MFKNLITFFCCCFLAIFTFGQDVPYPVEPLNMEIVNDETPTLRWKGNASFNTYTIEVFDCDYVSGENFNSINLEAYDLIEVKNGLVGYEASALTLNEKRTGDFFSVDDEGTQIIAYQNNYNSSESISVQNYSGNDYEGLTYLYNDFFVMVEERLDELLFLKMNYNSNGNLTGINQQAKRSTNNPFITGANDGYEGITYNPVNNRLYLIKEYNPTKIFEFVAPTAPNFNESIILTEPFNLENQSWTPNDVAGLYHLSLNQPLSATKAGEHLLLLSQQDYTIFEIDLNGNVISQKILDVNGAITNYSNGFFQPEGICYNDGKIWIASEGNFNNPAKYYVFQNEHHANPSATLGNRIYFQSNISAMEWTISNCILKANKNYCWKITGYRSDGTTAESALFNFNTQFTNLDCGSTCPFNVVHSANSLLASEYRAENNVITRASTQNGTGTLRYYAGNRISIREGFHASQTFSAYIEDCP